MTSLKQLLSFKNLFLLALFGVITLGCSEPQVNALPPTVASNLSALTVPAGFEVSIFAGDVPDARSLSKGPEGVLFVGNRRGNNVWVVIDQNDDGVADIVRPILEDLQMPNGVAYHKGNLWVATLTSLLQIQDIDAWLENLDSELPAATVIYDDFPDNGWHGWKFIRMSPKGELFVPVGSPCNVCEPEVPFGRIHKFNPEDKSLTPIAVGVRHTVGFDWDGDGTFWFTDNGRDHMGDNSPPDELNRLSEPGEHFGFPYCHGGEFLDPEFGKGKSCEDYTAPIVKFPAHVATLGIRFYDGSQFPDTWQGAAFIAEHGSWNRTEPDGYRVSVARKSSDGSWERSVFLDGFLTPRGSSGRPVDVEVWHDGSLLVSDDSKGKIYRVRWIGEEAKP